MEQIKVLKIEGNERKVLAILDCTGSIAEKVLFFRARECLRTHGIVHLDSLFKECFESNVAFVLENERKVHVFYFDGIMYEINYLSFYSKKMIQKYSECTDVTD